MRLAIVLGVIAAFFISFTFYGFVIFSRFLNREKEVADRFRADHGGKSPSVAPKDE